ncbi:aromatic ring-hydroxylating dioxygenase subunit alpha [Microbulbifer sp. VAAC004]|uniref:aromatic ring-hydroxylating oxygenase subunit alpha n=1 Tax=unclassified Microbulbifer TaxID=2619833 RepID=UPI0040399B0B
MSHKNASNENSRMNTHERDLLSDYQRTAESQLPDARCLPFGAYTSEAIFQREMEQIFEDGWVFITAESSLAKQGDYFALNIGRTPVALVRGADGQLRALSNTCRHRGTPLLDAGFGNASKRLVCPYHAWSYSLEGSLQGAPFTGKEEVDKAKHCLPVYRLEIWCGLVFVDISGQAPPLSMQLAGLPDYLPANQINVFDEFEPGKTERWAANWKVVMENAMESYHLFKVHRKTLETVTPTKDAYYSAGCLRWTLTGGAIKSYLGFGKSEHYQLLMLPPNFTAIIDSGSLSWLAVIPCHAGETEVLSGSLVYRGYGSNRSARKFADKFFAEDQWICERVQRGMNSPSGKGGTLVEAERIIVNFHHFLASRLFDRNDRAKTQNAVKQGE